MGNNNSSERYESEPKRFTVTGRDKHDGWVRFHLDDYVPYNDGNYKHVDFDDKVFGSNGAIFFFSLLAGGRVETPNRFPEVGDIVEINLRRTRRESSSKNFSSYSSPLSVIGKEIIVLDNGEVVKMFLDANRDLIAELRESGERYKYLYEQGRWVQEAQRWTSWEMPPK